MPDPKITVGQPTILPPAQQQPNVTLPPQYMLPGQQQQQAPLTSSVDEKQAYMDQVLRMIAEKQARKAKARRLAQPFADKMDPMAALAAASRKNETYAPGEWYDTVMSGDAMYGVPQYGPHAGDRIAVPEGSDKFAIDDLMFRQSYPEMYPEQGPKKIPQTK